LHITNVVGLSDTEHVGQLGDWVRVDPSADKPLFDQLRIQIIDGIRQGRLAPGTRLPTVRELAGQVGLAVNTVARAYRELESAGVLETRGRYGTFVARADPADAAMAAAAHSFAEAARALGIGKSDALRYLDAAFD
jgi:DNA-binding transcriptional regulator YhcF (GntR family)